MILSDLNFKPEFKEAVLPNPVDKISPLNFINNVDNNINVEPKVTEPYDWKKDLSEFLRNNPDVGVSTPYQYNKQSYEKYHKSLLGKPIFKDPRYYDNEDLNAQRQGFLGSLFNGSTKMIGSFGQSFVSTFNPVGYDNTVSNAMQDFSKNMENWFPNYYSKEERENPLSFNSIFSGNFLGDKLIKNLGFMGGAMTAALMQDAILGTITGGTALAPTIALQTGRAANWMSKAFKANTIASKLVAADKVENFLKPLVFKGEKALEYFNDMTKGQKLLTSVKTNLFLANASHGEAAIEALEGLTRVREDLIQSYKEKNGILPDAVAMAEINKLASEAGNIRYGLNFATIFLTDAIQFGSLFKPFKSYTTGQTLLQGLGGSGERLVLNEAGQLVRRNLSKSEKVLGSLTGDLVQANISESLQEGLQYSFETATHDYAKKKWNKDIRGGLGDYLHEQVNGLKRMVTDVEGRESMLLGFLTGFAAHGFKKGVEKLQGRPSLEKREDSIMSDFNSIDFDKMFDTTELSELVKRDVETFNGRTTQEIILNQMQDAIKSGNVFDFKSLQHELFFNGIRTANALGKFDAFVEKLEAMKQLAPEEFSKVFGIEVKDSNVVSQYIGKLKDQAVKTKEIIEAVDNTIPNTIDYKKESKLWTAFNDLKTTMAFHLSSLDNITSRIDSVTSTLLENNPSMTEDLIDKISDIENFSNKFLLPLNEERRSLLNTLEVMSQLKEEKDEALFNKTKQQLKDLDDHIDNLNKHANTIKEHFNKTNNWTADAILNYKQLVLEVLQYNQQKESGNKIAYTETQLEDTLKALIDFQKLKKSLGIVIDESNKLQTPEGRDKYLRDHIAFLEKYSDSFSEMIKKVNISTVKKFRDQEIATIASNISDNITQIEAIKNQIEEIDKQLLDEKTTPEEKELLEKRKEELIKEKQELLDENNELEETKKVIEGKEELTIEEQIQLLEKELSTIEDDNNPRIKEIDDEISKLEKLLKNETEEDLNSETEDKTSIEDVNPVETPTETGEKEIIITETPNLILEAKKAPLHGKSRVLMTVGKMGSTLPKDMKFAGGMLQNFYNFMGRFETFDGNLHMHNLNSFLSRNKYKFVLMVAPDVLYTKPDENGRSEYFTEGTQNPDNIVIVLVDETNNPVLIDGNYIASKVGKDATKDSAWLNEGKLPDDNQSLVDAIKEVREKGFADLAIESTSAGHYNFIGKKEKFEIKELNPNTSFEIFTHTELKEMGNNFRGYTLLPGKLYLKVVDGRKTVMYLDVSLAKMSNIKVKGEPISKNIFDLINHLNNNEESDVYRKSVESYLNSIFHTYHITKGGRVPAIFRVGESFYKFEVNVTENNASIRIIKDGEVAYELSKEKQDELSKLQSLLKIFDINDKIFFGKEINLPTIEDGKLRFNLIPYTDFILENANPTVNYKLDFLTENPFEYTNGEIYFKLPSKVEEAFTNTGTSSTETISNQSEIKAKKDEIERRRKEELDKTDGYEYDKKFKEFQTYGNTIREAFNNLFEQVKNNPTNKELSDLLDYINGRLVNEDIQEGSDKNPLVQEYIDENQKNIEKASKSAKSRIGKINAKYDAEYIDKVRKGEFTAQQAKDALKEINRLTPELSKQLDDAELNALEPTKKQTPNIDKLENIISKIKDRVTRFNYTIRSTVRTEFVTSNIFYLDLKPSDKDVASLNFETANSRETGYLYALDGTTGYLKVQIGLGIDDTSFRPGNIFSVSIKIENTNQKEIQQLADDIYKIFLPIKKVEKVSVSESVRFKKDLLPIIEAFIPLDKEKTSNGYSLLDLKEEYKEYIEKKKSELETLKQQPTSNQSDIEEKADKLKNLPIRALVDTQILDRPTFIIKGQKYLLVSFSNAAAHSYEVVTATGNKKEESIISNGSGVSKYLTDSFINSQGFEITEGGTNKKIYNILNIDIFDKKDVLTTLLDKATSKILESGFKDSLIGTGDIIDNKFELKYVDANLKPQKILLDFKKDVPTLLGYTNNIKEVARNFLISYYDAELKALEAQEITIDEKTLEGFSSEEDLAKAFGTKPLEQSKNLEELTKEVVEPERIKIEDIFKDEDSVNIDIELMSSKKLPIVQSLNVTNSDIEKVKAIFKGNVNIENLFQIANSDAWATFQQSVITLFKGATRADLFHEAWHHFSQLYLTKDEKVRLYEETKNKVKDLKDKSDLEVEEYIAREFAKFTETGKIEGKFPERKSIFQKIMDFLKSIFSNETDLSLDSLFNNLYKGQINHLAYNTENIMFGKLNSSINDNFNYNESKLILSGLDALVIKALKYKNISSSQISRIENLDNVYSLITVAIKNIYKKSFDNEGYSINPTISINLKKISDNWNDVKRFHFEKSIIFNKDKNLYTINEEGQIVSTDENEDEKKGRNKADYQEASERSVFDILPSEVKNLIYTLVDTDKNGNEIIDPIFGFPKLVDYQRYVQVISQKLSDQTDFSDVEKALTELAATYPPMKDLLESLTLNDSNEVKQLRVKFINSMALAKVKLYTILYNEENKDYQAQDVFSNTRRQAESNATSYFNISPETRFIKKINGENQITQIGNVDYNEDNVALLKDLGMDMSFTDYMSTEQLSSFLKSLQIPFLVNHLRGYLKQHGVIKDVFKALNTKIDGQSRDSVFKRIVKADLEVNPAYISATSLNAENKLESENVLWSTITKDIKSIQKAKSISELVQNPNRSHFNFSAVDMDSSVLLNLMFDKNGNRTNFEISVDNYNGINNTKQGETGVKTKDVYYIEKAIMDISQFVNNNILTTMQLSNKATYLGFKLSNKLFNDKYDFEEKMLKYLFTELDIIEKFHNGDPELTKLKKLSEAIGTKDNYNFAIFEDIIINDTQEIINEYLETGNLSEKTKTNVLEQINSFFNEEKRLHAVFLGESLSEIVPSSGSKYSKDTLKETLLDDYIKNQFIFNVELSKITFGNPYMHKDPYKRIAGATSTGTRLLVDDLTLQDFESATKETQRSSVMPLLLDRLGLKEFNLKNQRSSNKELRFITFNDREMPSKYYNDLLDAVNSELSKHKENSPEYKALLEKKKSIQKAYSKVNGSDAMGAVTMDAWRKFNWLAGRWTPELEKIYEKTIKWDYHNRLLKQTTNEEEKVKQLALRNENAIDEAEKLAISVMKYQYYGNVKNTTIMEKAFHKFQLMPLIPQLIEGKLYEHHLDRMIMEDVDYLLFDSADKLEKTKTPNNFYNNKEQDNVFVLEDFVNTYRQGDTSYDVRTGFIENLKEQVFMENGTDYSLLFGTQIRALLFNTDSFSDLYDEFRDVISQLTQIEKDKLYEKASLNSNGEVIDKNKFVQFLLDELDKKVVNYNIKDYLRLTKAGEFAGSLDTNLQRTPIESIINSVIQNKIVKQKMHGEMMVQVSNVGFETFGKKDSLKFYGYEQDGKVRKMEVKVPLSGKFKNLLNLNYINTKGEVQGKIETRERLNDMISRGLIDTRAITMVGYRIPTQEHNSVEVMIVQEFLDPISNLIVVPYEITAKAGSDFDIDKLNIFKPHIDENGYYIESKFKSKSDALNNYLKIKSELTPLIRDIRVEKFNWQSNLRQETDRIRKNTIDRINILKKDLSFYNRQYRDMMMKGTLAYETNTLAKEMETLFTDYIGLVSKNKNQSEYDYLYDSSYKYKDRLKFTINKEVREYLDSTNSKFIKALFEEYTDYISDETPIYDIKNKLQEEYNNKLVALLDLNLELENKIKELVGTSKYDSTGTLIEEKGEIKKLQEQLDVYNEINLNYGSFKFNFKGEMPQELKDIYERVMGYQFDLTEELNKLYFDKNQAFMDMVNFKKSKQNKIIEIFEKVLLAPDNFINLITPNSTSLFDEAINNVFKVRYTEQERQEKKGVIMPKDIVYTNSLLPRNSWDMHRVFGDSGKGLGIAAVGNKFSQLIQKAKVNFTDEYLEKYNLRFKLGDLSNRSFQNGESKGTAFSQLLNLLVDVANDPRVGYVNMGDDVIPIVNLMINFGIDIEQIIYLINQPIIVDYIKYSSKNSKRLIKGKNDKSSFSSYLSTKALSTKSPLLSIDDNYAIKNDMSATEIAEKLMGVSLENNKENIGLKISQLNAEEQLLLLSQFAQFEEMSKDFLELQMTMNFDTNTVQDGFEAFQKENSFEDIKTRNILTNLDELKYNTVISPLNVLKEVVNINAQLLPLSNSKLIYNFLSSKLSGNFQLNSNKNKARFIRTFKNDYIMYLFQNFLGRSEKALLNFNTTFAPVLKIKETNKKSYFTVDKALEQGTFRKKQLVKQIIDQGSKDKPIGASNNGVEIKYNPDLLKQKFEEKAWLKPTTQKDGSKAKALPENIFSSFDEFFTFVLIHEIKHDSIKKQENETIGQYEDRINNAALEDLRSNYNSIVDFTNKPNEFGIHLIKNLYKEFAEIKNNPKYKDLFNQYLLLDRLFVTSEEEFKNIGLSYYNKDSELQNTYIEQFKELLNNPNLEIRNFMLKFAYMGFYQSGLNKSLMSSTDVLPIKLLSPILENIREQYLSEINDDRKLLSTLYDFHKLMYDNNEFMRSNKEMKNSDGSPIFYDKNGIRRYNSPLNNRTKVDSKRFKDYTSNIDKILEDAKPLISSNALEEDNTPTQQTTEQPINKEIKAIEAKGIEINSYQKGLGNSLTNVHYAKNGKSEFDIVPSDKSLKLTQVAKSKWGESVEAWYKSNNAQTKGIPEGVEGDKYDFDLMIGLITDKLNQYPDLVKQINERGGLEFLQKSTHNMGSGRWSSKNPKNMFMNSLIQAYKNVNQSTEIKVSEIYNQLRNKTQSKSNNIVFSDIRTKDNKYDRDANLKEAKENGRVYSMETKSDLSFSNPWAHFDRTGTIKTNTTKEAVMNYITWLITDKFQDVKPERRKWILDILKSGQLKGKPIQYYAELNEPSHATALDWLLNSENSPFNKTLETSNIKYSQPFIDDLISKNIITFTDENGKPCK